MLATLTSFMDKINSTKMPDEFFEWSDAKWKASVRVPAAGLVDTEAETEHGKMWASVHNAPLLKARALHRSRPTSTKQSRSALRARLRQP